VVISDKTETTVVDLVSVPADFLVKAIYVNEGEHAYASIRFDQNSKDWLTGNLHLVKNSVTRFAIWRYFWIAVKETAMSSLQYMAFIENQIPKEGEEQILQFGLLVLKSMIDLYLPSECVLDKSSALFEALVGLLYAGKVNRATVVDYVFNFITTKEQMELVLVWLEKSKIENEGALVFELTNSHKYSVLRMLFKDPNFSKEMKLQVLERTLGEDKSDPAEKTRIKCLSGLPDAMAKEEAWLAITDVNSKESIAEREAKMSGFYSWN